MYNYDKRSTMCMYYYLNVFYLTFDLYQYIHENFDPYTYQVHAYELGTCTPRVYISFQVSMVFFV